MASSTTVHHPGSSLHGLVRSTKWIVTQSIHRAKSVDLQRSNLCFYGWRPLPQLGWGGIYNNKPSGQGLGQLKGELFEVNP